MTSMDDESWRSWFCDLEAAAGDCSFILGGDEVGGEFKEEKLESYLCRDRSINSYCGSYYSTFNTQDSINMSNSTCTVLDFGSRLLERGTKPLHMGNHNSSNSNCANNNSTHPLNIHALAPLPSKQSPTNKPRDRQLEGKDHIIAERMRRQKITQHFIALSALIPGLKKADKSSVLEETIKYMKQLQERLKVLEEQSKKKSVESEVFMKKSQLSGSAQQLYVSDTTTSSNNSRDENSQDPIKRKNGGAAEAEVEARVSEKEVLIRIQCEKPKKGVMKTITREIEKLHLSVMNSSAMPFGSSILDITIIAEKGEEFRLSAKELAGKLRVALLQLM